MPKLTSWYSDFCWYFPFLGRRWGITWYAWYYFSLYTYQALNEEEWSNFHGITWEGEFGWKVE